MFFYCTEESPDDNARLGKRIPWMLVQAIAVLQLYIEEKWIHKPLRSLSQVPPLDAAGHVGLRKKLRGVVQFLEDCAATIGSTSAPV